MNSKIITLSTEADTAIWSDVLTACGDYDVYHTAQYHTAAGDAGQGKPVLLVVECAEGTTALPLLIRTDSQSDAASFCDAVSVYGYGGPVSSVEAVLATTGDLAGRIGGALLQLMRKLQLVSVFTRMHPLLDTAWVIDAIGETKAVGPTVVIDLKDPLDQQQRAIRKGHRSTIKKALRSNIVVKEDPEWRQLDDFVAAYAETMGRVGATDDYSFSHAEFLNLHRQLGEKVRLFHALVDGQVIASSMFFACNDILQYHLGATYNDWTKLSPSLAILDHVRLWGAENDFRWLHLGGGVQGNEDAVFRFKSGMSKLRKQFEWGSVVVDHDRYDDLTRRQYKKLGGTSVEELRQDFFPLYRASMQSDDC